MRICLTVVHIGLIRDREIIIIVTLKYIFWYYSAFKFVRTEKRQMKVTMR